MFERQLKRGIEEFNQGLFFECHDTLEELWMETVGEDRLFLQGLIQVSVGFYHLFNRNFKGSASQFTKALQKLERYRPAHRGVELQEFTKQVVGWLVTAERGLAGESVDADQANVPRLQFNNRHHIKENSHGNNDHGRMH
jgi:uncharacterized protein